MQGIDNALELLSTKELTLLHQGTLEVLENPGMTLMAPKLLRALEEKGCQVDYSKQTVRFLPSVVEKAIETIKQDNSCQAFNSGNIGARNLNPVRTSLWGSCMKFFDYDKDEIRPATIPDLVKMMRLGENMSEVFKVQITLLPLYDSDGNKIDQRLLPLKTAAIMAKNTSRPGGGEIWDPREIDFLVRIGCVLTGSWEEYKKSPLFLACKETISPLKLTHDVAEVLLALAERELPCAVVPMPIMGATAPVTPAATIVIANAEILGVLTAIKAFSPKTPVGAGIISGILDMATASVSYAAPEACMVDVGILQLYRYFYGLDMLSVGVGYTDAKYPGIQAGIEKAIKMMASASIGKVKYDIGLLNRGSIFSPEQAMIDLEMGKHIQKFFRGFKVSEETVAVEVIRKVGIGGNFLTEEHTLKNFRTNTWFPQLYDRIQSSTLAADRDQDILKKAHRKVKHIIESGEPFCLDKSKAEEIDRIVQEGEKVLLAHP